jgi:hypothetical protein
MWEKYKAENRNENHVKQIFSTFLSASGIVWQRVTACDSIGFVSMETIAKNRAKVRKQNWNLTPDCCPPGWHAVPVL